MSPNCESVHSHFVSTNVAAAAAARCKKKIKLQISSVQRAERQSEGRGETPVIRKMEAGRCRRPKVKRKVFTAKPRGGTVDVACYSLNSRSTEGVMS